MTHIRPFEPRDTDGVVGLILPIQQGEFGLPVTDAGQPDLRRIAEVYQREGGGFWVATNAEGAVVGTVGLLDFGGGGAALRKMYVRADHRGDGTARRLLEALIRHARAAGLGAIFLGTADTLLAAHAFYRKHGFAEVAAEALPDAFPRVPVDTRFYRLELDRGYDRAIDSKLEGHGR